VLALSRHRLGMPKKRRGPPQRCNVKSSAQLFCRVTPAEKRAYERAVEPLSPTEHLRAFVLQTIANHKAKK
jgi:hypothetical protein